MTNRGHSERMIPVEHVTIRSGNSFPTVKAKLEALLPQLDEEMFTFLHSGENARALQAAEALPTLSIFGSRDHGSLLKIAAVQRRAMQYDIGNPLTASKMTRHQTSAALYAPIRVVLLEDSDGVVAFEYDRPASVFGQFGDHRVDVVAHQLDKDLRSALEAAAS